MALAFASAGAHQAKHPLPKPGGSTVALAPIPPAGKHFGFNDLSFLNKRRFVAAEQVAGLASRVGANVHRYEISWKEVEPVRDRWDEAAWGRYVAIDRALSRAGIRSLVVLSSTPPWARDRGAAASCQGENGCEYPPSIDELDHWREFAAEVAKRLRNPIVETWNEPNLALFFKPRPNPTRFARMHVAAYEAIDRARPRTPVLLAGNANTQSTDTQGGDVIRFSHREFLTRIYRSVKGKFDGISIHPYLEPPPRFGRRSLISHALHDVRSIQRRFKDRGNQIWVTETGISTTGPRHVSPGKQASGLLATYRQLMTMADVKAVLFHTLFDQTDSAPRTRAYGFGMVSSPNPLRVKAAYCAFNGRSGLPLTAGCKRKHDRNAPGAKRERRFKRTCGNWLKPQRRYRRSERSGRNAIKRRCLLDLLTIEAAKRGRVKQIRRRAERRAISRRGAFDAARGREGLKLARREVRRLARRGYL